MTYGNSGYQPQGGYGYQSQYATSLDRPQWGQPAMIHPAGVQHAAPSIPVISKAGRSVPWWLWVILAIVLILVVGYFTAGLGQGASTLGFLMALVPLGIVITGVYMIDRWEPEPLRLLLFALFWGAVISIAGTLLIVVATDPLISQRTYEGNVIVTVLRAPIVEEIMKGIGLLVIVAIGRRALDGPIDGVVYGALIGAGFAFTENIQYFGGWFLQYGAEELGPIFFVRGLMSPFCHAMFTACTGFAIGLAARRGRSGQIFPMFLLGLVAAIGLHALWNFSAIVGDGTGFFTLYVVIQMPLFAAFIVGILWLRREEARLTRMRLGEYAMAGWFTPQEVDMLATRSGRSNAMAWAKKLPAGDRSKVMKQFIHEANQLAATRQRALTGKDPHAAYDEYVLLQRTTMTRNMLLSR